jgi:hypothetical protein
MHSRLLTLHHVGEVAHAFDILDRAGVAFDRCLLLRADAERSQISAPARGASYSRAGRVDDPEPECYPHGVTSCGELVGSSGAFHLGRGAVAFEHQVRDAPNVDLGYHAEWARRSSRINV